MMPSRGSTQTFKCERLRIAVVSRGASAGFDRLFLPAMSMRLIERFNKRIHTANDEPPEEGAKQHNAQPDFLVVAHNNSGIREFD